LDQPFAVAVDSSGNVYIAESARIRKVAGGIITTFAGNGIAGASGDNGPAANAQVSPLALAVDSAGNVYLANTLMVTCGGSCGIGPGEPIVISGSIRKISNGIITTIAGNGACCAAGIDNAPALAVPLYGLSGLAVDHGGNVYAATTGAVRKIAGGIVTTVAGGPGGSGVGDGGPATAALLSNIGGLAVDSAGNLYIADKAGNRIREVSQGLITTVAGTGAFGSGGDGGLATNAQLMSPWGVAVDPAGNIYIADTSNLRIREVSHGVINTVAGNSFVSFGGDNGPATSAQLGYPGGIALDPSGNLYIAGSSRVREVTNGTIFTIAGNGSDGDSGDNGPATAAALSYPSAVALDSAGNLYIADDAVVRKVSKGTITTVAGGGKYPFANGDGGPATNAELNPRYLAVDLAGNLYISDNANVRKVSNGIITSVAGNGTVGFSGDGGPATAAQLFTPHGIAFDAAGNLYIADAGNVRIRKVSNGIITTVAGNGTTGWAGDGGPATSAELAGPDFGPEAIALDPNGNLYIASVDRIRKVSNGVMTTIAGPGSAYSTAISANSLVVDAAGDIYYSGEDNRVKVLKPCTSACPAGATPAISAVLNAGSFSAAIESGSWVAIMGANLANSTRVWQSADFTGSQLPTQLDGVAVTIDGRTAFVEYVSPTQINVLAPSDNATGTVSVLVTNNGAVSAPATAQLQSVAPAFFVSGSSAIASLLPNYTPVTAAAPAHPGDIVALWGTGFGVTNPATSFDRVVSSALPTLAVPVVTVGGVEAPVVSSILAAGSAGLYQVTIQLPANVPTGAVTVQASVGGAQTQSGVSLFVSAR
jgi:uncharacterized protein (TIGR03437 family)